MKKSTEMKAAVITGGNSGIGLAIATALAQAEYNLVISGRRQSKNRTVAEDLARRFKVQTLAVTRRIAFA
jgi:short-subunit dehydrogenase